jgi:phage tail-like protein
MENESLDARDTTSRARFLGGAAGLTGLAFAGGIFTKEANAATKATAASGKRSYVAGNFALSLDGGKNIGMLKSAQGGQIFAEPVAEPSEGSLYAKKHIGNVKYSDITVQMGLSMPSAFYQWIADSWNFGAQRKNGAVIGADFNRNAVKELDFTNAFIQETTIPAMDAASKDAAYLVLKLTPESTRPIKASGTVPSTPPNQKQWLPANFKLELGKLDTSKVSKIDSFTIKQTLAAPTTDLGDVTFPEQALVVSVPAYVLEPGKIDFPNLRVTIAEDSALTWIDWYESFVREGNNSDDYEKSGSIRFFASDLKTELARVDLFGVGIFNLTDERPLTAGTEAIPRLVAELYVERMAFAFPGIRST